jgi:hypothetical protein
MEPRRDELKNGRLLLIREARGEDARALLDYVEEISVLRTQSSTDVP